MARSLFTLAAAVAAALPEARVASTRPLTAGGEGRYDSAVATLSDGREAVVRTAADESSERELSAQIMALQALTPGVREMLDVSAPEYLGAADLRDARAIVTTMLTGYQIDAGEIPAGDGAARSVGRTLAAIHALPPSVVRSAGLRERTPSESRADADRILDTAAASGHLPVALTVRWREAIDDDRLWAFESTVGLGGATAGSFLFGDDERDAPEVTGVIDWHGLCIDDPAVDLRWVASAPDAARDVLDSYARHSHRAPDGALEIRSRFHAELEFARWLVNGIELHREDIIADAAALLESLVDGVRGSGLLDELPRDGEVDMDDAIALIGNVPERASTPGDSRTGMETDAYDPGELGLAADARWNEGEGQTSSGSDAPPATEPIDLAAVQRSMSSSSDDTDPSRSTRSSET